MLSIGADSVYPATGDSSLITSNEVDVQPPVLALRDWLILLMALAAGAVLALVLVPGWLPQLGLTLFGPKPRMFWYLGRSSAFVAYIMLWFSIMLGLMMTSKLARVWPGGPATFDLHQSASMMGLFFGTFHAFVLMGSRFLHYDVIDVLVPFHSDAYRTTWVAMGQLALYFMVVVGFSFYVRRRITQRVWRVIHFLSFAVFVMVLIHGVNAGTDTHSLLAHAMYIGTGGGVICLTVHRVLSKFAGRAEHLQIEDVPHPAREQLSTLESVSPSVAPSNVLHSVAQTGSVVTILFGSQSGNAEGLAKRAAKAMTEAGVLVSLLDGAKFKPSQLKDTGRLIIVTSTCGEGDPPDNIAGLYRFLHSNAAISLAHLEYCVVALGDSSYTTFCKAGKDFDNRLAALGGRRLCNVVTCDGDYEKPFRAWLPKVLGALQPGRTEPANSGSTRAAPATGSQPVPPVSNDGHFDVETKDAGGYSRARPFPAPVIRNVNLHSEGDTGEKQTRHLVFSLNGSNLRYEPGDILGIVPTNGLTLVAELIQVTGLYKDSIVALPGGGSGHLVDALLRHYDITRLTRTHIEYFAERTSDPQLLSLLDPANSAALKSYLYEHQLRDLVVDNPKLFKTAGEFVSILTRLNPRMYSISSSQKMHPDEVHLTVGVVRFETLGRSRHGVCSGDLSFSPTDTTKEIFVHSNKSFRLPADPNAPVIMVGPGTGIAPFRAFLEERATTGAPGKNWLIFGCQYAKHDFLYHDELMAYQSQGVLTRLDVAASRDQAEKIYVQTLMLQNADELWRWLSEGAYFYVCGDATRMAKDVDAALHEVAARTGGLSAEQAAEWVSMLREQKRYLRDVY